MSDPVEALPASDQILCHPSVHKDIAKRARKSERDYVLRQIQVFTWPCEGDGAAYCAEVDECGACQLAESLDGRIEGLRGGPHV